MPLSDLDVSLISYLKLEEISGTRIDSIGPNNLFTLGSVFSDDIGIIDRCVQFTGSGSVGNVDVPGFGPGDWTFSIWVYISSLPAANQVVMSRWDNNDVGNSTFKLTLSAAGALGFNTYDVNETSSLVGITITVGIWNNVVFGFDSSLSKMFISFNGGALVRNVAAILPPNTSNLRFSVGRNTVQTGVGFIGKLDELGYWSRALQDSDIALLWNGGLGARPPSVNPPVSSGLLNQNFSPIIFDE